MGPASDFSKTDTHCYWGAEVGVHQRTLKHGFLFIENVHVPPLEKLWLKKNTKKKTQSAHTERHEPDGGMKGVREVDRFGLIPVVLVSVSWVGCPPPLSCASSPLGSVLCSCSGSSCSYLWPDWLTALMGTQRHIHIMIKTVGNNKFSSSELNLLSTPRVGKSEHVTDICFCFRMTSLIIGRDDKLHVDASI